MTQEEWDNISEEERTAEFERCKNPCYVYNTYWLDKNGNKPTPISQEEWDLIEQYREELAFNRFRNYRPRR